MIIPYEMMPNSVKNNMDKRFAPDGKIYRNLGRYPSFSNLWFCAVSAAQDRECTGGAAAVLLRMKQQVALVVLTYT